MPEESRSVVLTLRVTPAQDRMLRRGAAIEGDRLSSWLRRLALVRAAEAMARVEAPTAQR